VSERSGQSRDFRKVLRRFDIVEVQDAAIGIWGWALRKRKNRRQHSDRDSDETNLHKVRQLLGRIDDADCKIVQRHIGDCTPAVLNINCGATVARDQEIEPQR
jgi:hypothetical protein